MSKQYDIYVSEHISNVKKGFFWIMDNIPDLIPSDENDYNDIEELIINHDKSKWEEFEYQAYDAYFYGRNRSSEVVENFNKAWLMHIHENPHHWQYWILRMDDPDKGEVLIDMPYKYIIEMVCDWWSFSWKEGDLYEIFNWYKSKKDYIKLSEQTRKNVENILAQINKKLYELKINNE